MPITTVPTKVLKSRSWRRLLKAHCSHLRSWAWVFRRCHWGLRHQLLASSLRSHHYRMSKLRFRWAKVSRWNLRGRILRRQLRNLVRKKQRGCFHSRANWFVVAHSYPSHLHLLTRSIKLSRANVSRWRFSSFFGRLLFLINWPNPVDYTSIVRVKQPNTLTNGVKKLLLEWWLIMVVSAEDFLIFWESFMLLYRIIISHGWQIQCLAGSVLESRPIFI